MAKAVIIDDIHTKLKTIENKSYSVTQIKPENRSVTIKEVLPFRVKFTIIGIEGTGPNNFPAIPLQVIGFSNYIL